MVTWNEKKTNYYWTECDFLKKINEGIVRHILMYRNEMLTSCSMASNQSYNCTIQPYLFIMYPRTSRHTNFIKKTKRNLKKNVLKVQLSRPNVLNRRAHLLLAQSMTKEKRHLSLWRGTPNNLTPIIQKRRSLIRMKEIVACVCSLNLGG